MLEWAVNVLYLCPLKSEFNVWKKWTDSTFRSPNCQAFTAWHSLLKVYLNRKPNEKVWLAVVFALYVELAANILQIAVLPEFWFLCKSVIGISK